MTPTRWLTRVLSAVLALGLFVGSLLVFAEVVAAALGRGPWLVPYTNWTAWAGERSWNDWMVNVILAGLVVVGLLLLALALRRGRPAALPLHDDTPGVSVRASRRSVEKSLVAAASRIPGVTKADASVRRRSARIRAQTTTRGDSGLRGQVDSAVKDRLDSLGLARQLRTRVKLSSGNSR